MAMTVKGGVPIVKRVTTDATGMEVRFPFFANYLKVRNRGAAIVRLYFTDLDFAADANYVELPVAAATHPHGEWDGPVETVLTTDGPQRVSVWLRAASGNPVVEVVAFQRRG